MTELSLPREVINFTTSELPASEGTEESELIERSAQDKNALEELYIKYKSDVFAFSLGLYNNRTIAEDCVQETFIRLPSAAKSFRHGSSELAFILGIAKNVSRELYRSEIRFRAGAQKMESQNPLDVSPQTGMLEIVRSLPQRSRTVLLLRLYSGMSFKEMSKLLKLPESTLKSRYSRAVKLASREYMKQNG